MGLTEQRRASRLSVVVPAYKRADLLREALASIRAVEGPDIQIEIIVGDNGASPETRVVSEAFGARYIDASHRRGAAVARNAALRAATGDFLAFLDDDDVWLAGNIRPQLALLEAAPELDAVIGQVIYADHKLVPNRDPWPSEHPGEGDALLRNMLGGFFPQLGTTVARMRVRELVGAFDEALLGGQDLDWLLRIARRRTLAFQATPCILFRGRPLGGADQLQFDRIKFDRRVFFRHAIPEWKLWDSPLSYMRAYSGTLMHFYTYFIDVSRLRAARGERVAAMRALAIAVGIFPLRSAWNLLKPSPLRRALVCVLGGRGEGQFASAPRSSDGGVLASEEPKTPRPPTERAV
jgi:glycosyltransferase involved in cell wall biosynthesis